MEAGEIVKIETLLRLADVLGTSLPSLLGLGTEYYRSAIAYMERMRHLEEGTSRIVAHFDPISVLLTSDAFEDHLAQMLRECGDTLIAADIDNLVELLRARKRAFHAHPVPLMSLIGLRDLERFVYFGFVGRMGLPQSVRLQRIMAAREEVERIAVLAETSAQHLQIGVLKETMPSSTFQIFERDAGSYVALSPYRFVNFPNIRSGIASVTAAPEAVKLYSEMAGELWSRAAKGAEAAHLLRQMLNQA